MPNTIDPQPEGSFWVPPPATRVSWPRGVQPSGLTAIAEAVLLWLLDHNGATEDGNDVIGEECRMGERTARKALQELETAGLVERTLHGNGRRTIVTTPRAAGAAAKVLASRAGAA